MKKVEKLLRTLALLLRADAFFMNDIYREAVNC